MALSPQEFEKLKTQLQARKAVGATQPAPSGGFASGVSDALKTRGANLSTTLQSEMNPATKGLSILGQGAGFVADVVGSGIKQIPYAEEAIGAVAKPIVASKPVQDVMSKYNEWKATNPEAATNLESVVNIGSLLPIGKGVQIAGKTVATGLEKTAAPIISKVGDVADATKTTLFGRPRPLSNIEDVIKQADEATKSDFAVSKTMPKTGMSPSQILTATERASAQPNIIEKWAGVSPDIKNRISGKQEMLKEYLDVTHSRNNFDTLPTALEYGVTRDVLPAVSKMESLLNDTGSQIGKFRQKIGTYKANVDNVTRIETSFNNQLSKLNLEIKGGVVKQKAGTIARVNSANEIKVLDDLLGELQIIKQSPDLQRLIDFRNLFDSKINFAKSTRDVSSSLDPFSRAMRKEIADVAAQIVGKSEAANLAKFSQFMDGLTTLKSFTDRKAGAEFLLKQVLSERGRLPREIMQTIKEFTGIDLMDTATMSSLATDLAGNARQRGVFRQEVTKAGLDAASLITGNTTGAIGLMLNFLKKGLNEEKIFLKAAK